MFISTRLALTALGASALLAAGVSTASAGRLSTSNQSIRATWRALEFAGTGSIIRCQVTLEGSFHSRTIAKTSGSLIGMVSRVRVKQESCTNGIAAAFNGAERYNGTTSPNTLPWHLRYVSFEGTLPTIRGVKVSLAGFRFGVRDGAGNCTGQYGTEINQIFFNLAIEAGGAVTSIEPREPIHFMTLAMRDGGIFCEETIEIQGSGPFMLLGSTTRVTVTLI
jgi:hypothetical protein